MAKITKNGINYFLGENEEAALKKFLTSVKVSTLLKEGGAWAIIYEASCGVGTPITATACNKDKSVILTQDITDYGSW
jgi:hypothetical protein